MIDVSKGRRPRIVVVALVVSALWMGGCSSHTTTTATAPSKQAQAVQVPAGAASLRAPGRARELPDSPPDAANCSGTVTDSRDFKHPNLGALRVFLVVRPNGDSNPMKGCVAAVSDSGAVVTTIGIEVQANALHFANPPVDATGNVFVVYNPGRYDGVLVLVPDANGFQDIGWTNPSIHYQGGRLAYYYSSLQGPGSDGRYTIRQSDNSCAPSCAEGTVNSKILQWNGNEYVPS